MNKKISFKGLNKGQRFMLTCVNKVKRCPLLKDSFKQTFNGIEVN